MNYRSKNHDSLIKEYKNLSRQYGLLGLVVGFLSGLVVGFIVGAYMCKLI